MKAASAAAPFLAVLVAAAVLAGGLITRGQAADGQPPAAIYTYRIVSLPGETTADQQKLINDYGASGWEMVSVDQQRVYFKKRLR